MCPICNTQKIISEYILFDDRYGYLGGYQLLKCSFCNHQFTNVDFTPEQLKDLYSNYYPRSNYKVENYRPHEEKHGFREWLDGLKSSAYRYVPRNVRILDIGCGFCETIGYHQNRGCEAYGVEADENARRVAKTYDFKVKIGLFNPDDFKHSYFDYVTLDQVIEHAQDPIQTLKGISKVLKTGGRAILSTPNANGWGAKYFKKLWINWHIPYHLQFFSKSSIKIAAKKADLLLDDCQTITNSKWLYYQFIHLVTYPEKGIPSKFWNSAGDLSYSQKLCIKIFSILYSLKIFHLITRAMDLISMGDNLLITLHKK